ncbi:class I SAM-dependent methyltransferase [Kineosporiaceae bacterium B12]|nr:class I SAM-dependent methyltransferase [Kineococcus rubinsiae]
MPRTHGSPTVERMDHDGHGHAPHEHGHHQQDQHEHDPLDDHQQVLDLDAELFGSQLDAVLDLLGPPAPQRIVDLGAGTGTGSRLLRDRFPGARVTAVDHDPAMLDRLREQGFTAVDADLGAGFPDVGPVDLVWAALSLHHVPGPARLLEGARAALTPGGRLVVVELDGLPQVLGTSLEERLHTAAAADGWNRHPDWTPVLEAAGFAVTRSSLVLEPPASPAALRYAQLWLPRFLTLAGLDPADRAALAALLERPAELAVTLRATRTVWLAEIQEDPR